jgi:hypothetical protein
VCSGACCAAKVGNGSFAIECQSKASTCAAIAYGWLQCDDDSDCAEAGTSTTCCARLEQAGHLSSSCVAAGSCTTPAVRLCNAGAGSSACTPPATCQPGDETTIPKVLSYCK